MKTKKQLIVCVSIFLFVALSFMGAQNSVNAAQEAKTLKVGALTNLGWTIGVDFKKFLDVAVPMYNEKGGLVIQGERYNIEIILYDTKLNPETGRAAVERLVNRDQVKFILGDETIDAWLPVTETAKVLVIATTPSPAIFSPKNKLAFQSSFIHTQSAVAWGWFSDSYPDLKTVIVVGPDNMIGHGLSGQAKFLTGAFGIKLLDTIFYPPGTTNFGPIATKIRKVNPDVFTTAGGGEVQDALLYKSLYETRYKGQRFTFVNLPMQGIQKVIPLKMIEGLVCPVEGLKLDNPPPLAKAYKEAYVAKHGSWDDPDTLYSNELYCLLAGLEQAQSLDPEKVAAVIANGMKFETLSGPGMMVKPPVPGNNRTVDFLPTVYVRKVEDGKSKFIRKINLEEGMAYTRRAAGGGK